MSTYLFGCTMTEIDADDTLFQLAFIQEGITVEAYEQIVPTIGEDSFEFEDFIREIIGGGLTYEELFKSGTTIVMCVSNAEQKSTLIDILGEGDSHFLDINIVNLEENHWYLNTAMIPEFGKVPVVYEGYHDGELLGQMHPDLYNIAFLTQQYEQVIGDKYGVECLATEYRIMTANPSKSNQF